MPAKIDRPLVLEHLAESLCKLDAVATELSEIRKLITAAQTGGHPWMSGRALSACVVARRKLPDMLQALETSLFKAQFEAAK